MNRDHDDGRSGAAACTAACDRCGAACLQDEDVRVMSQCITLDLDGAAVRRLAAMARATGGRPARQSGPWTFPSAPRPSST